MTQVSAHWHAILLSLCLCACGHATEKQDVALVAGRDAVTPCRERFHEQGQTYADCVSYIANKKMADDSAEINTGDWRRLGVLYTGWVHADLAAQQGDADAARAARQLLNTALPLQEKLHATNERLCILVGIPCATLANRQRDILASKNPF